MRQDGTRQTVTPHSAASLSSTGVRAPHGKSAGTLIVDSDVHPKASEAFPLGPHIPDEIREALRQNLGGAPTTGYANPAGSADRLDAECLDPHATARDHLDRYGITYAILQSPGMQASVVNQIDVGTGIATAWNRWQKQWLDADDRYRGSICVNMNDPQGAIAEIERCAGDSRYVQVLASGEQRDLLGHRRYWPIYEAIAAAGLPFCLHPGQEGVNNSVTPIGRVGSYFEWHTLIPIVYQSHLVSLVLEGVFEKFPGLKVILCEGGIFWAIHTTLRMDKNFKGLRSTAPWLKRRPSEYVWDHVRLTTQPLEEPDKGQDLVTLLEMVHADRTVMFATDFPHWDFDDPNRVFPKSMPDELKNRIFYDNAAELYGLPSREEVTARQPEAVAA
ncbi:MAG: amidohydrolase family protein [Planctomycetota bacterium]